MSGLTDPPDEQSAVSPDPASLPAARTGNWKPMLTLLVLSPAIGELLSGSSPPLQFFNPIAFLFLVGLYGCGALLIRETVIRRQLTSTGLLLLGAAYGILEEGITCKSFFNPNWTDTGLLSVYGRAAGVNWVWAFGLTVYHMVVSITVPIFLTEALFSARARNAWLRPRGLAVSSAALALVVVLGYSGFDNRQFHVSEIEHPLLLAQQLDAGTNRLQRFITNQFSAKHRDFIRQAVVTQKDSPELAEALQNELNRVLTHRDLYSPERFAAVDLTPELKSQAAKLPRGDQLIIFNRALLECAVKDEQLV